MEYDDYMERGSKDQLRTQPIADGSSLGQAIAADLIASVEVPECSVAASDTAERAEEFFNFPVAAHASLETDTESGSSLEKKPRHRLNLLLADNEFLSQDASVKWVSQKLETAAHYSVRLALALPYARKLEAKSDVADGPTPRLTLFAVTRHHIAFPLARFGRANQDFCDHIQFWGEEDGDELQSANFYGWGEDDNGSRFDAVQTLAKLFSDDSEAAAQLIQQLQLNTRLEGKLGPTTPETEQLIANLFDERYQNTAYTFSQEFPDQQFGRVRTDITAQGTLAPVKNEPLQRKFSLRVYPSSQAERNWEPREFIADMRSGITTPDGAARPRELDTLIMLDLLEHAQEQRQLDAVMESLTKKKGTFMNRYFSYHAASLLGFGGIRTAYDLINHQAFTREQYFPGCYAPAVFTGLGGAALAGWVSKKREARKFQRELRSYEEDD